VFRQDFKNEARYYILHLKDLEALKQLTRLEFKQVHDRHWQIECFHRVIKQVCNIEHFQVRDTQAIHNHFFCSLRAFAKLQKMRVDGLIDNLYQVSILRTKLSRDGAVGAKLVEIRVRFNRGKV